METKKVNVKVVKNILRETNIVQWHKCHKWGFKFLLSLNFSLSTRSFINKNKVKRILLIINVTHESVWSQNEKDQFNDYEKLAKEGLSSEKSSIQVVLFSNMATTTKLWFGYDWRCLLNICTDVFYPRYCVLENSSLYVLTIPLNERNKLQLLLSNNLVC